jgi:Cys/Met metabolism PLP-dependent enzyme
VAELYEEIIAKGIATPRQIDAALDRYASLPGKYADEETPQASVAPAARRRLSPALAAPAGSAIGGLTSLASAWLTTFVLPEAVLAKLEGGAACLTFGSGMAAATAVFLALIPTPGLL